MDKIIAIPEIFLQSNMKLGKGEDKNLDEIKLAVN